MQRIFNGTFKGGTAIYLNVLTRRTFFSWITAKAGFEKLTLSLKQNSGSLIAFTGAASAVSGATAFLLSSYGATKEIAKDSGIDITFSKFFSSKIKESEVATEKYDIIKEQNLYVERPLLQEKITQFMDRKKGNEKYYIMYGAKGVGKSTITERAAKDKKGVLMIRITTASSMDEVMQVLIDGLNIAEVKPTTINFISALKKGKSDDGTLPSIIIEIERAGCLDHNLGIQAARGIAKDLSAACNFLIILSEDTAVLEFGTDSDRENFIYIGEFSEQEAREYIIKLGMKLDEKDFKYVMNNVGANPATLRSMEEWVHGGKSVQDFVAKKLAATRRELVKFPHKAILKALKQHPEGVDPEYFKNMKNEGVNLSDPAAVGSAMKQSDAVVYRIELGKYMIISRCHQTALKSYDPV